MNQRQRESSPVRLSDSPLSSIKGPKSAQKPPRPASTNPTSHTKSKSFEDDQKQVLRGFKYQSFVEKSANPISKPKLKINVQDVSEFQPIQSVGDQSSHFKSCISRGSSRDFERSSNVSSSLNSLNYTTNDNVKVCVRVRPLNERERMASQFESCLEIDQISNTIDFTAKDAKSNSSPNKVKKQFSYDFVANEQIDQEQFFEIAAKPIVDSCLNGMNGSIFAYGQTGAGKTYTIQGTSSIDGGFKNSNDRGIIQRSFEHIFAEVEARKSNSEMSKSEISNLDQIFSPRGSCGSEQFTLKCSFFEIYNEQIIDLLRSDSKSQSSVKVQETKSKDIEIQGITYKQITKYDDVIELIAQGTKMRHVGETKMNSQSSRSHSVLSTFINSVSTVNGVTSFKKSTFHIIDLAGSERNKDTQAKGDRLKEAGQINKSLSALGNVIKALSSKKKELGHVPYRSSKLTFILKNSLGGNSKTLIIANISPSLLAQNETISTLEFAKRAKMMRNQVVVNEDFMTSSTELKKEIERLKQELEKIAADHDDKEAQTGPFFGCDRCYNLESQRESSKEEQDLYMFSKSSVNDLQCKEVMVESLNFTEEEYPDDQQPFNEISEFNQLQLRPDERRNSDRILSNKKMSKENVGDLRLTIGPSPKVMRPPMHSTRSHRKISSSPPFADSPDFKKASDISKSPMGFQLNTFFNLQNIQEELDSVNKELKISQDHQSAKDDQYQELLNKFINIEKTNQELQAQNQLLEDENKELGSKFVQQSQQIQELQKEKLDKTSEFEKYEAIIQRENEQIKLQMQHKTQDLSKLEDLMKKEKEAFKAISKKQQDDNSILQEKFDGALKDLDDALKNFDDVFKKNEMSQDEIKKLSELLFNTQKDLDVQEDLVKKFKEKEKKLLAQNKQLTSNSKIYQEKSKLLEQDKKDLIQKNQEFVGRLEQLQRDSAELRNELDQKEIIIEQLRKGGEIMQSESSANGRSNLAMSFLRDEFNSSAQNQEYMTAQKNKQNGSGGNASSMLNSARSYEQQRSFLRQRSPDSENFSQISKIDNIKSIIRPNDTSLRDYNISFFGKKNASPMSPEIKRSMASNNLSSNERNASYIPYRDVHVIEFDNRSSDISLRQRFNKTQIDTPGTQRSIAQNEAEPSALLETSQITQKKNKQNTTQTYQKMESNQEESENDTTFDRQNNTYSCEFESQNSYRQLNTPVKQQTILINNKRSLVKQQQSHIQSTAKKDINNNLSTAKKEIFVYNKGTPSTDQKETSILQQSQNKIQENQTVIISNEKIGIREIQVLEVTDEDTSHSCKNLTETKHKEGNDRSEEKKEEECKTEEKKDTNLRTSMQELQQDSQNDLTMIQCDQDQEQQERKEDMMSESGSCNSEFTPTVIIDDFSSPIGNVDQEQSPEQESISHFQLVEVNNEQSFNETQESSSEESSCHEEEIIELKSQIDQLTQDLQESQETNNKNQVLIDSLNKRIQFQESMSKKYFSDFQSEVKQSQLQSKIYLQQQKKLEEKFKDIQSEKASLKREMFDLQNKNYNLLIEIQNLKLGQKISDITSKRSVKTITPKFGGQPAISFVGRRGKEGKSRGSSNKSGLSKNNISMSVCSYEMEIQPTADKMRIPDDNSACGYKTERDHQKTKSNLPRHIRVRSGNFNLTNLQDNPMRVSADFSRKSLCIQSQRRDNSANLSCCQSMHSYKEESGCKLKQWTGHPLECQSVPYQETDMRF